MHDSTGFIVCQVFIQMNLYIAFCGSCRTNIVNIFRAALTASEHTAEVVILSGILRINNLRTYSTTIDIQRCILGYNTDFTNARSGSMFHEDNATGSSYTVFIGTDECIFCSENPDAENDRVLVLVKDSYGNAMVPFLAGSFRKVYLCDFRYFGRSLTSFAQEVGATDVAFAMSTVAVTTAAKVDQVERMIG